MKGSFSIGQELDKMNERYEGKDDFLSVDVLTMADKVDAVRATLFSNMLQQAVCLANAEPPRVFTRYENQVGKYSSSYYKTKEKMKVIAKIRKFSNSDNYYILIVKKLDSNEYDLIERKVGEKLTENYCFLNENDEIDKYDTNDKIEEDKLLTHSTNFDNYSNYSYGLNAKSCFMIHNDTIEDAILISESFQKRSAFYYMYEVGININTNDLLINKYGKDGEYKSFPDIGEETDGKVLCSRRRINYDNALFDLKDEQLRKINYNSDTIFYAKGTVVDIDVYSNADIENLKKDVYNNQIVKYIEEQNRYYQEIKNVLEPIIENENNRCSDDLKYLYRRAKEILDPEVKWKNDKTDFDNIHLVIKVLYENKLHVGSKLAGRYGNKGVISGIKPDSEMPVTEDGIRAEMIVNALGVCNRLNPAQLYEQEINFISDNVAREMKSMKLNDAKNFLFDYIKTINKNQYKDMKRFYNSLDKKEKVQFIKENMEYGIRVHQPPFWGNLNLDQLEKLYDKYGYDPYKCFINGEEIENPLIIADMYMMRLKHEPSGKMSTRSTSFVNMKNSPSKSLKYKKHEEPYSKTPIRIGEMELVNLLLTKNSKIQAKFNNFYSNNEVNRRNLNKVLLSSKDVLNIDKIESTNNDNGSKTLLNVLFKIISIKLEEVKEKIKRE